jgi:hypothetical protein
VGSRGTAVAFESEHITVTSPRIGYVSLTYSPGDALRCLMGTDIEVLVIEYRFLDKSDQNST